MKKLAKFVTCALIAALVSGGGLWYTENRASGADVSYRTARVRRGSLRSTIQATGTLSAEETVDVGTQISGTIREIYVDYNDKVKEGQLIAVMDSRTQQADVDMAKANVLSAKADLAKANAKLLKANRDLNRTRQLVKKDLIARSELDADVADQATAKADVLVAQAKVAQYEATLRKQEINLSYTKIYSPVDGVVVAKNVEKGQTVAASYQTPSIAEIARDLKQMQVEVNVDEADIGSVKVGQRAEFTVDAYTDATFTGSVTQVRISPKSSNSVVSYTVIVKVNNDEEKLMPGMTANVSLIVTEKLKSPVRCVFSQDRADFHTTTTLGAAHDVCTLSGDGKDLEIGFNNRYLSEALRYAPADTVRLELNSGISPAIIVPTDPEDESFLYMVLPVRLKA